MNVEEILFQYFKTFFRENSRTCNTEYRVLNVNVLHVQLGCVIAHSDRHLKIIQCEYFYLYIKISRQ